MMESDLSLTSEATLPSNNNDQRSNQEGDNGEEGEEENREEEQVQQPPNVMAIPATYSRLPPVLQRMEIGFMVAPHNFGDGCQAPVDFPLALTSLVAPRPPSMARVAPRGARRLSRQGLIAILDEALRMLEEDEVDNDEELFTYDWRP